MYSRDERAEIVVVGSEILTGKIRDENSPYLTAELRALGVEVTRLTTIPDDVEDIARTVAAASERVDHVLTTGGVGPTLDDLTFEGVARAFGRPRRRFPALEAAIREHFGATATEHHFVMADLPDEAELIFAHGLRFPVVKCRNVYVFPGSPEVLRRKWVGLRERFRGAPFVVRRVYTTLEEGLLSPHLDAVKRAIPSVALGSYPVFDDPTYAVLVTLESRDAEIVRRATEALLGRLDPRAVVRVE